MAASILLLQDWFSLEISIRSQMNCQIIFWITGNGCPAKPAGQIVYAPVTVIGAATFLTFYYKVIDRLTADVKRPFKLDKDLSRIDDTPIHASLRECLANALIHADYYGCRSIVIDKEFRKVTISNPGTFRISIDEAIAGGISDARNGKIFNMFALINVGERSGSGLCDVYNVWEENRFKRPEIVESISPDRVTLTLQIEIDGNLDDNDGNFDGNDGNPDGNLTPNEQIVLTEIVKDASLSAAKIGIKIGISKPSVERIIRSLKQKGYIRREGSTRGRWIILK